MQNSGIQSKFNPQLLTISRSYYQKGSSGYEANPDRVVSEDSLNVVFWYNHLAYD